ncbi:hypothetical protein [Actinoplanes sp. NPDC049802]|uniref:hypothetical protein n=1 Tax=Actinoplanes sp. NPDC049802 TaxID=3154742 RepID=UPI0033CFE722
MTVPDSADLYVIARGVRELFAVRGVTIDLFGMAGGHGDPPGRHVTRVPLRSHGCAVGEIQLHHDRPFKHVELLEQIAGCLTDEHLTENSYYLTMARVSRSLC